MPPNRLPLLHPPPISYSLAVALAVSSRQLAALSSRSLFCESCNAIDQNHGALLHEIKIKHPHGSCPAAPTPERTRPHRLSVIVGPRRRFRDGRSRAPPATLAFAPSPAAVPAPGGHGIQTVVGRRRKPAIGGAAASAEARQGTEWVRPTVILAGAVRQRRRERKGPCQASVGEAQGAVSTNREDGRRLNEMLTSTGAVFPRPLCLA